MRVYLTSDLHLLGNEPGGDEAVVRLASFAEHDATENDVLILNGDLGSNDLAIMNCLAIFSGFPGKKLAVLGNHDLWSLDELATTRYQFLQTRVLPSFGFHSLDLAPCVYEGIAFVGSIGWYDYSLARIKGVSRDVFSAKILPEDRSVSWGDAFYVDWGGLSDEDVTELQLTKLRQHLEMVQSAEKIVVAMHHLATRKLLVGPDYLVPRKWGFLNAFLGSTRFSELFAEFAGKISRVFCGHVHNQKNVLDQGVKYTSLGGDYRTKEILVYNPADDTGRVGT